MFTLGNLRKHGFRWFRLWDGGPGIKIVVDDARHPPLFSERNGFTNTVKLFGYRITYVKASKS